MSKVFVAAITDHEGLGTIELSVHASEAGATQALREMCAHEFFRFMGYEETIERLPTMDWLQIFHLVEDEFGVTAKVEEHEVQA